jgi:hypothetical protein
MFVEKKFRLNSDCRADQMMGYCELISECAQDISRDVLVSESQIDEGERVPQKQG